MKVKVLLEIEADIPGEFQNDALAVSLIDQEIRDLLSVGVQYDKYDQPDVLFNELNITQYIPGKGKL